MLPAQPNQSLMDGLRCLQTLAMNSAPVGVRAMARQLKLEPTRVHRLLKTLAHLGMAQQTSSRKYFSGPAMHVLSAQSLFASGLIRRALKHLEALRVQRLTVAMGVLWKDQVCYLLHAAPSRPMSDGLGRTGLYPASRSSIGLALLAWKDARQIRELFEGRKIEGFPRGIDSLLKELHKIRKKGYARVMNRSPLEVSIAASVGNPPEAAIALAGAIPSSKTIQLIEQLKKTAEQIEHPDKV